MDRAVDQIDLASVLALNQKRNLVNAVTIARAKKKSTLHAYAVRLIRLITRLRQRWIDETNIPLIVTRNAVGACCVNNPRLTNGIAAQ